MVCKENVVSWFGNLTSYKRIDVMVTMLNMCLPFEVRYLGTCIEDRGKRDYNDLRDTEHHSNNITDLSEIKNPGITDTRTRRKLILYIALLNSCNYQCATILYKNLANIDTNELPTLLTTTNDEQLLDELLLLYTMALNHPAFTYEQKTQFGNIYLKLQDEEIKLNQQKLSTKLIGPEINDLNLNSNPSPDYLRNNSGIPTSPTGLGLVPGPVPGLPVPENPGQFSHVGFPNSNGPWQGQNILVSNQLTFGGGGDTLTYPVSPLVSRQSSPSQSRSPSRSNSPMGRRGNSLRWSTFDERGEQGSQNASFQNSRQRDNQLRGGGGGGMMTGNYLRNNSSSDGGSCGGVVGKHPPPPRLRGSVSSDALRETLGKEMMNFKGNLQNLSLDEIRRMSDDDLREIGLTPNAVGQLRNIVRGHTPNGLNQNNPDRKMDNCNSIHNPPSEQPENETGQTETENSTPKPTQPIQDIHIPPPHYHLHHHHHHNNNNTNTTNNNHPPNLPNLRRYPALPPGVDPTQIPIYHPPPTPMYPTQTSCFACLPLNIQNRYPRCSAQHMYCVAELSGLKLDSDNGRHYSQSSSSDSTGSRSPPETPPAAPWTTPNNLSTITVDNSSLVGTINEHPISTSGNTVPPYSITVAMHQNSLPSAQQQQQQQQQQQIDRPRRGKNHGHMMRHKNQLMNGAGGPPPNLSHCVSAFPVPTTHPPMTFIPQSHFSGLRGPNNGIYTSGYPHSVYTRPFQPNYQQNGEILYSYAGQGSATPPPPPPPPPVSLAIGVGLPSSSYMTTREVGFTQGNVQQQQQSKISCYNCGSCSHVAIDCKDQSMEDLTKRAQYRLDYTIMKQPSDCPSNDE